MNRKAFKNKYLYGEQINCKKLYKSKKQWLVASMSLLFALGLIPLATLHAHASTTKLAPNRVKTSSNINTSSEARNRTSTDTVAKQAQQLHKQIINCHTYTNAINRQFANATHAKPARNKVRLIKFSNNASSNNQIQPPKLVQHKITVANDKSNKNVSQVQNPILGANKQIAPRTITGTSTQIGKYQGLNYIYDPDTSSVEFTGGTSTWTSGYGNNNFIGGGSSPAPSIIASAKHVKFDNGVNFPSLTTGSGNSNFRYFIANDPNVESIYIASDLANAKATNESSSYLDGMFASDINLKSLTIPNGLFGQYDSGNSAFDIDNKLSDITILHSPISWASTHIISSAGSGLSTNLANQLVNKTVQAGAYSNNPNIKTGIYDGLNYFYNPTTSTVLFNGGTLTWNSGVGKYGNWGSQQFIGNNDEKSTYGQPAPACMNSAKHIIFRNINADKNIYNQGNFMYFIASNNTVESIDLGSDFKFSSIKSDGGDNMSGMFASDQNLQEIDIPNHFINGNDNAGSAFNGDDKLVKIKIYNKPIDSVNGVNNWTPALEFASNDGITGTWYNASDFSNKTNPMTIGNGNTSLKPDIYYRSDYTPPTNSDIVTPSGNIWNNLHEGSAKVTINGTNDTINISDGTLENSNIGLMKNNDDKEFASDIHTNDNKIITPNKLPNANTDWTINFSNVKLPKNAEFIFDGKNDGVQHGANNFIGNQVKTINTKGLDASNVKDKASDTSLSDRDGAEGMFINDDDLQNLNISSDFGATTGNIHNWSMAFGSDNNLQNLDLHNLDISSATNVQDIFNTDNKLKSLVLGGKFKFNNDNSKNVAEMFSHDNDLKQIKNGADTFNNVPKITTTSYMFGDDHNLTSDSLQPIVNVLDTSSDTDMHQMFQSDLSLHNLDLSHFNTAKVTNMEEMFASAKHMKNLNISSFNTSNVNNMTGMFGYSDAIDYLDFPSDFDTTNAYNNMGAMFESDIVDKHGQPHLNKVTINSSKTKFNNNAFPYGENDKFYKIIYDNYTGNNASDLSHGNTGTYVLNKNYQIHVSDTINYVCQGKIINTKKFRGYNYQLCKGSNHNTKLDINSSVSGNLINNETNETMSNYVPNGYQLSNNNNVFNFDGGTHNVSIKPISNNDKITVNDYYNILDSDNHIIHSSDEMHQYQVPKEQLKYGYTVDPYKDKRLFYSIPDVETVMGNSDKQLNFTYNAHLAGNLVLNYYDDGRASKPTIKQITVTRTTLNHLMYQQFGAPLALEGQSLNLDKIVAENVPNGYHLVHNSDYQIRLSRNNIVVNIPHHAS